MNATFLLVPGLALAVLLAGCTFPSARTVHDRRAINRLEQVRLATVEEVRPVTISGQRTAIGRVGGAATGAVVGREIGGGRGSDLAQVAGGIAGAVAGEAIEEAVTRKEGVELTLRLDSGETYVVVQEAALGVRQPGQRVRLITSGGAARVEPL
jgi:outer membrane lipoprotein SlyB